MSTSSGSSVRREDATKNEPDFVTVVSVGSQSSATVENFVTVLSIGNDIKNVDRVGDERTTAGGTPSDIHPEEQVEVFRLPGEPLGFGLKFEGGAKNAEKVKRLFVQSCAEQSPASRAKCSWGTIGEGDEVLSIDGVPVTHMSRLDCVRRLKESQLVIKLLIRCRGALRPEVVSAERKSPSEIVAKIPEKIPPALPSVPPPVPPRKLRQARGSADGEANPIPAKKTWNVGSPTKKSTSGSSSQTDSPETHCLVVGSISGSRSSSRESPNSIGNGSSRGTSIESPKKSSNETSPEMTKSKLEPPEAMVYLDARSQDGSSTHGSTSDDTGSSMSTVIDRFSTSDRFSTVSTTSTTSGGTNDNQGTSERFVEDHPDDNPDFLDNKRLPAFAQLEQDFLTNSTDYLLKRLASSEAVTHVESRGEPGGVVERITAVVAPNTVVIEETMTLQPPLSFQDAPLSYGHETTPGLVYTADLAGDSTTHFRPISDEAAIVERVNGENLANNGPTLPARNHVNRIPVNQASGSVDVESSLQRCREILEKSGKSVEGVAPILPPKPMPRKDVRSKRKRPPPPPPPPPRRDAPPAVPLRGSGESPAKTNGEVTVIEISNGESSNLKDPDNDEASSRSPRKSETMKEGSLITGTGDQAVIDEDTTMTDQVALDKSPTVVDHSSGNTNKVLEIIEMKKIKAFDESTSMRSPGMTIVQEVNDVGSNLLGSAGKRVTEVVAAPRDKKKLTELRRDSTLTTELEDSETSTGSLSENWQDAEELQDFSGRAIIEQDSRPEVVVMEEAVNDEDKMMEQLGSNGINKVDDDDDEDETYRSLDEIKEDFKSSEANGGLTSSDEDEEDGAGGPRRDGDSTSDDSEDNGDDDYYWQSNLATIGEEEETSSLEYTIANREANDSTDKLSIVRDEGRTEFRGSPIEINESPKNETAIDATKPECVRLIAKDSVNVLDKKLGVQVNADRMENCGGDQRLPPDGDEFPATYQEYSGCTSDQYQYQAVVPRTPQRNKNNNNPSTTNNDRVSIDDIDDAKNRDETTKKHLSTDSMIVKNFTNNVNSTILRDKLSSNYSRNQPVIETRSTSQQSIVNNSNRQTIVPPEIIPRNRHREEKITDDYYLTGTNLRSTKSSTSIIEPIVNIVSEKTFEVTDYHKKDEKSTESSEPPPLPLTGPPKSATFGLPITRNNSSNQLDSSPQRKFSSNGDLWRQDDKSEKSVRDKIAMFSSQSSLENPLFPNQLANVVSPTIVNSNSANNYRRLSKYKSSDDVFNDDAIYNDNDFSGIERTRSSVDLTDSRKIGIGDDKRGVEIDDRARKIGSSIASKNLVTDQVDADRFVGYSVDETTTMPIAADNREKSADSEIGDDSSMVSQEFTFEFNSLTGKIGKPIVTPRTIGNSSPKIGTTKSTDDKKIGMENSSRTISSTLARATSFSGEITNYTSESAKSTNAGTTIGNGQISRTNSLASTFRRNSEDMRRQSLNQLIEQRRKGISKLRGLVIPEKNALPIDKPIIDLPEIKSRDSILLHQIPKSSITDKWGSQSSLASTTSSSSTPVKPATSFKMPAPQIMSKYSPAFKRKSLTVYGSSSANSSATNTPPSTRRPSPTHNHSSTVHDPPKSLESICSPTRSDCSFEFASSASVSPDTGTTRGRPRQGQRKFRIDYDDSDCDSALSSSQSSVSRGFSPPTSPGPSSRSSLSSETSYHTSLIIETPGRICSNKDSTIQLEKMQYQQNSSLYNENRGHLTSKRSSSSGSAPSTPNPRSPLPEIHPRTSHIPQRHVTLKRSSSTETNCSSSSSTTLTSGSQTSVESLSRRVLKPQSVEAINRKNILASAKCRSGRDNNGSPLIQRKFNDEDEEGGQPAPSSLARQNGRLASHASNGDSVDADDDGKHVKIAYIEVTEMPDDDNDKMDVEEVEKMTKESTIAMKTTDSNLLEASNDLKMWVRSEAKALMAEMPKSRITETSEVAMTLKIVEPIVGPSIDRSSSGLIDKSSSSGISESRITSKVMKNKEKSLETCKTDFISRKIGNEEDNFVGTIDNDVSTISTTKSRSRASNSLEQRNFSSATRQMSLEDILVGKTPKKIVRTQSTNFDVLNDKSTSRQSSETLQKKLPTSSQSRNNDERSTKSNKDVWSDEKSFVSKIPMFGRGTAKLSSETMEERSKSWKSSRSLDRRSSSVTDMKKALEKTDQSVNFEKSVGSDVATSTGRHQRFSSLDSTSAKDVEVDCVNGEQFGSISSLASSTSLISQQELAQLVEDASSLVEDGKMGHEVVVVLLHKENPHGSVGIILAGGSDCEAKEITVHRVLAHSVADKDGRVQRGDRILSINGRSTRGMNHRDSLGILKQPRSEVVLVVSRSRHDRDEGSRLRSRTDSVETIVEGSEGCGTFDDTAWGPATRVAIFKDGAGLGFSLAGGRDSPLGDRPLVIKKIFTGGAAEKTAALTAGDQLLEVNGTDVTRMSRIEAWSLMKKLSDGEANLLVRHPATKSS